jgi:pimeloyl-ACP methyl ester carboxylesterase
MTASHLFRNLIPLLADRFRLVAPDIPGFGQTEMPPRETFTYTFDNLAHVINRFADLVTPGRIATDGYSLDNFYLARPGADEIQLDLFRDYASNVRPQPRR